MDRITERTKKVREKRVERESSGEGKRMRKTGEGIGTKREGREKERQREAKGTAA